MHTVCNFDLRPREEVLEGIREFVKRLSNDYTVYEAYVFGSFVRDEMHEGSDIDMIIVADIPGKMHKRIAEVLKYTGDLPIEPLVYTPEGFKKKKEESFMKGILEKPMQIL